ncbi:hypothetical protein [Janibacter limosus]|uniref:ABC-2 type transport system permease protein n=1 Tax=Janibacter limosus TaxID=53458 RepID=A0A4P6MQR2_9MICO|nr:hypothetical protein [Janibacter limosus]QBF45941.1 hypothetical protein EXU32_06570 [Janibacter limosus]
MSMSATFASMRWTIIRHGPHDERGFGLVVGLVAASGVIVLAALGLSGALHPSWLTVGIFFFGVTWLLGPILVPGSSPTLDPQWFRTLPRRPRRIARELAPSEAISVGTVITAVALSSFIVVAALHGPVAVIVATLAVALQLVFLLWLGRCAAAVVAGLLRSTAGTWMAAVQMSVLLAISFAGWVPIAAVVLPNLGEGGTELITPSIAGAVPIGIERVLLSLPTGWGLAAVLAATSSAPLITVAMPLLGLLVGVLVLRSLWIGLTARVLRHPPARTKSNVIARSTASSRRPRTGGPTRAVMTREIKTWFRDPHRRLGMIHAWITPLFMVALVAPTSWSWALPFIGIMAAVLGAMVAVNTYALDGTALWQLLTTPGAISADVRGRQLAWLLLFGIPTLALTLALCLISQSPLSAIAFGMTVAAIGAACGSAPLLGVLMPAIGADARDRVSSTSRTGNPAGAQYTAFAAVVAAALVPALLINLIGAELLWVVNTIAGVVVSAGAVTGLAVLTRSRLRRSGPALLGAMESGDISQLRNRPSTSKSARRSQCASQTGPFIGGRS